MPDFTDTERLDWILKTMNESGRDGLAERLHGGRFDSSLDRRNVDWAMDEEKRKRVRLWECPICRTLKAKIYVATQPDSLPRSVKFPAMCGECAHNIGCENDIDMQTTEVTRHA